MYRDVWTRGIWKAYAFMIYDRRFFTATASARHPRELRLVLPTYRIYLSYPVLPLIKMAAAWDGELGFTTDLLPMPGRLR